MTPLHSRPTPTRQPRFTPEAGLARTVLIGSGSGSGGSAELDTPEAKALFAELRDSLAPRYTIIRALGAGGMGAVYLGVDPLLKRSVAVKVLLPSMSADERARQRFIREAELAAAVAHPNVAAIFDVGVLPVSGAPYFVMQYIDGVDLATLLASAHGVPEIQARRIVGEIAAALAAAHARGLVHRDIKPQNVLIERESGRAHVVDFGISAVMDPRSSHDGAEADTYLGTPTYTSPEHARGESLTGKSDVYSLGVLAWELLTGRPPFGGGSVIEVLRAHVNQKAPPVSVERPELSAHFASIVDRCLAKTPDGRPAAAEVARALLADGIGGERVVEWPPPGLDTLRRRGRMVLASLTFAAAMALALFCIVAVQPTSASGRWDTPEASAIWSHLSSGGFTVARAGATDNDSPVIWFFLLFLTAAGVLLSLGTLAVVAVRCGLALRDALRAGYPWAIARDVALDWWPDGAALRNSSGVFALAGSARCEQLVRWRRAAAWRLMITLAAATLTPWLWMVHAYGGWDLDAVDTLPGGEFTAAAFVLCVGVVLVITARWREWSQRVRSRRAWTLTPAALLRSTVSARPEIVASWMRANGHRRPKGPRRWTAAPAVTVAALVAIVALPAAFAAGALVVLLGRVTHDLHDARQNAYTWLDDFRHDSLSFHRVDSLVAAAAQMPGGNGAVAAARTQLARARVLLGGATPLEMQRGERMAIDAAARMRRAGLESGNDAAVIAALRVRGVVTHLEEAVLTPANARAVMADPAEPRALALVRDSTLMPAMRATLAFYGVSAGYCDDGREVLFGVDPRRLAAVRSAEVALRSVPGVEALARNAERAITSQAGSGKREAGSGWLAPLRWLGLGGLERRLAACLQENRSVS